MKITQLQAAVKSPALPESDNSPALPESDKSPAVPESAKTPDLPESTKSPALPESVESPALPEYAKIPPPLESSPAASPHKLDDIARKEKARLEELLKSKGGRTGSYPRFTVSVKGPKVGGLFYIQDSLCPFCSCAYAV